MSSSKFVRKVKALVKVTSFAGLISGGLLYYQNDEKFFRQILMPLSRVAMSPESSHKFGIFLCKWNLIPRNNYEDLPILVSNLIVKLYLIHNVIKSQIFQSVINNMRHGNEKHHWTSRWLR